MRHVTRYTAGYGCRLVTDNLPIMFVLKWSFMLGYRYPEHLLVRVINVLMSDLVESM